MSTVVSYGGTILATLEEGNTATLHTENTILEEDIQVQVTGVSNEDVSGPVLWLEIQNMPSIFKSEAALNEHLRLNVPGYEKNNQIAAWAKAATKPIYTYSEIGGTFPGVTQTELNSAVNAVVNSQVKTQVSTEVQQQLKNLTYANIGGTFPGIQSETDPTVPNWAKQSDKPVYTYGEIQDKLELGENETTAYPGDKGKQNADNIILLQQNINENKGNIESLQEDITLLQNELNNKITEEQVNIIISKELQEEGKITEKIEEKIAGLSVDSGNSGISEARCITLIDNTLQTTFSDWVFSKNPPIYSYEDLTGTFPGVTLTQVTEQILNTVPAWALQDTIPDYSQIPNTPTQLTIGIIEGTAYDGSLGSNNRKDIDILQSDMQIAQKKIAILESTEIKGDYLPLTGGILTGSVILQHSTQTVEYGFEGIKITKEKEVEEGEEAAIISYTLSFPVFNDNIRDTIVLKSQLSNFLTKEVADSTYLSNTNILTILLNIPELSSEDKTLLCSKWGAVKTFETNGDIDTSKYNTKYLYGYAIDVELEEDIEAPIITEQHYEFSTNNTPNSLVQRNENGYVDILVSDPTEANQPANKTFVDSKVTELNTKIDNLQLGISTETANTLIDNKIAALKLEDTYATITLVNELSTQLTTQINSKTTQEEAYSYIVAKETVKDDLGISNLQDSYNTLQTDYNNLLTAHSALQEAFDALAVRVTTLENLHNESEVPEESETPAE